MEKEIHEQPEVISHTLAHYLDFANGTSQAARPAVRLRQDRPAGDLGLRHGLSRRADRQILVRALCAAAGRHRCRLRIPLPRDAAVEGQRRAVRVAVGRNRRHAGVAALLPQRRPADRRDRQCARIDHRARIRRDLADACRAGDRRRLDQGLHLPACGAGLACGAGRGGARHGDARRGEGAGAPAFGDAALRQPGAQARAADREGGARAVAGAGTCSISAATPTIRSPWKAR